MKTPPPKDLSAYLKCFVYDLYVLAAAVESMTEARDNDQAEVSKTAALIKLRTVYDFLHRPTACDTIKRSMFAGCNPAMPPARSQN
jgi:hypothetical protein